MAVPAAVSVWNRPDGCQTTTVAVRPALRTQVQRRRPTAPDGGRCWYVAPVLGPRRSALAAGAAAVVAAGLVAGCGGSGERQDADEASGTFKVDVTRAAFPARQHLAASSELRLTVRNADTRAIPNVAVTLSGNDPNVPGSGFATRSENPALADARKPLWIVDRGPRDGDTVYVGTWALGRLDAGQSRTFVWNVTPVVGGMHTIRWRVGAGLNGKAQAQTANGDEAAGSFRVNVSRAPAQATVDPETGQVVRGTPQSGGE